MSKRIQLARNINRLDSNNYMAEEKKRMKSNTDEEYKKALASDDPTKISKEEQERLTREAVKKFKSLS